MIEHEVSRQKTRNEAVAMERLQGSPRVVDIYGYCGMSVATEFVGGNNSVKATRGMTPVEKLSVAIALAQGVADVHSVDGGQPTLTHSDLTKHNVLFTPDRRPKLQDFNMAAFVKRDKETGKACGPNRSKYWGDIYALGDIIFTLAVETSTWTILNGKPKANVTYIGLFPDQVKKSSDPAMQVMIKAIEACFRKQNKRPTAQHIVAFLQNKTSTI
jgi:serine/threonine protein kinase